MTKVYIEQGKTKAIACSLDWPGWCRIGKTEEAALHALLESALRYGIIAQRAGLSFVPDDLVIAERVAGDATTDFGAPSIIPHADAVPLAAEDASHGAALLRAAWTVFDETVAASPSGLRKGPRGGGRDRDAIARHVIEAERAYLRKIGLQHKPFPFDDRESLCEMRGQVAEVLGKASEGALLAPGGWPTAYALRRFTWHVVDHIWELEDRRI